jgi:hypothetical protein
VFCEILEKEAIPLIFCINIPGGNVEKFVNKIEAADLLCQRKLYLQFMLE